MEIKGETAAFRAPGDKPEFYFRLSDDERFAIIKLTKKKNARLVENVSILPVTNEVIEDLKLVATFKKQVVANEPTRSGRNSRWNPASTRWCSTAKARSIWQVWDFGVGPAGK